MDGNVEVKIESDDTLLQVQEVNDGDSLQVVLIISTVAVIFVTAVIIKLVMSICRKYDQDRKQ